MGAGKHDVGRSGTGSGVDLGGGGVEPATLSCDLSGSLRVVGDINAEMVGPLAFAVTERGLVVAGTTGEWLVVRGDLAERVAACMTRGFRYRVWSAGSGVVEFERER